MKETKEAQAEREQVTVKLRERVRPGMVVYTTLRHASKSGMYRVIDVFIIEDGQNERISFQVAKAAGFRYDRRHEGVGVNGCGMDAGFEIVYNLAYYLYPEGFGCIGEDRERRVFCPSCDHSNGDRDFTPHDDGTPSTHEEVGTDIPAKRAFRHWHKDGGYALLHRWL